MSKLILILFSIFFLFGSFFQYESRCVKCTRVLTFKNGEVKSYDSLEFFRNGDKEYVAAFTFDNGQTRKTVILFSLLSKIEHSNPEINAQIINLYK